MTLDSPQLDGKIGTTLIQHGTRAAEREMSSRPSKSVFSTPPSYKCASVTDAFILTQPAPVGRYVRTCAHTSWYAAPWHACSHCECTVARAQAALRHGVHRLMMLRHHLIRHRPASKYRSFSQRNLHRALSDAPAVREGEALLALDAMLFSLQALQDAKT